MINQWGSDLEYISKYEIKLNQICEEEVGVLRNLM